MMKRVVSSPGPDVVEAQRSSRGLTVSVVLACDRTG
jgi:hypothetical protein